MQRKIFVFSLYKPRKICYNKPLRNKHAAIRRCGRERDMLYPILALSNESTQEAVVKLHFALATESAKGEEFLRVDFLAEDSIPRLRRAVLRVVKERKRQGKILFFLPSEDFSSEKKEAALLANKYPELSEDAALLGGENAYILIRL